MEILQIVIDKEKTIKGIRLNLYILILCIPLWIIVSGSFVAIFGMSFYEKGIRQVLTLPGIILMFLGIPIHELLHAATWMLLTKSGFNSVSFGMNWESLTPYSHFMKPIKVWKYALGGAMPGFLMGVIPAIASYLYKNPTMNFVAFLFLWAAGADILGLWKLRKVDRNLLIKDDPDKMGFEYFDLENE